MYRIIVVEDETRLRAGICDYYPWSDLCFEIVGQMSNGREALDYIGRHPVDVVLTDISMPVMTGIELAEALHELYPEVRVVFLSGYADFSYAQKALRLGVADYILKPVRAADLTSVFSQLRHTLDERHCPGLTGEEGYHEKLVRSVRSYAKDNLGSASLEKAAEAVNLSAGHLSRLYKRVTGESFSDYLMDLRMREAKVLLLDLRYRTYQIAELLGYENPKNFTRAFRQYCGVSPRDYRNAGGEGQPAERGPG